MAQLPMPARYTSSHRQPAQSVLRRENSKRSFLIAWSGPKPPGLKTLPRKYGGRGGYPHGILSSMPSPADVADRSHMQRALDLARQTAGLASPNPQVGCVLVCENPTDRAADQVLGEGAHRYDERDHAEIAALKQAAANGHDVRGATAYVTLEPCAHHGRTGPCADALLAAGIRRCVVATTDPNPLVSGTGLARLHAAGVEVDLGPGSDEARSLNLPFAHFIQHGRPFVTLKAAVSVDGYLAPPPAARALRQPHWLTGPAARAEVHSLRHASDALLTGIGTVLADDPALTDRSGLPRRRPLLRVILDPHLRLPPASQLLRDAQTSTSASDLLLLCAESAPLANQHTLHTAAAGRIEILRLPASPSGRLSLPPVLALLAERNCLSLLLEAGSALNSAFLHEDLVDRIVLFFSPTELGAGSIPFSAAGPSAYVLQQRLHQRRTASVGADMMITGLLHDPWPALS